MNPRYYLLATLVCAALTCMTLGGCGSSASMRDTLGLNREGPDEYRVVPRPPLSVPPEFNLRPPGQATAYVSGKPADARAHEEVLGTSASADATPATSPQAPVSAAITPTASAVSTTGGESQFLSDAGASKADPQVRQKLLDDRLNGNAAHDPGYLFGGKTEGDSVVDATKEADRLKSDKSQNLPPTTGDTPVIVPEDKGILGNIF